MSNNVNAKYNGNMYSSRFEAGKSLKFGFGHLKQFYVDDLRYLFEIFER